MLPKFKTSNVSNHTIIRLDDYSAVIGRAKIRNSKNKLVNGLYYISFQKGMKNYYSLDEHNIKTKTSAVQKAKSVLKSMYYKKS